MFGFLAKIAHRFSEHLDGKALAVGAEELDRSIIATYRRGGRLAAAIAWRLGFR
ncbi:MAG: hypothetical protein GTN88_18425, partial [Gammaproteobacteria bacterium]|nr:hypothetical protein [Gammaproteobacteria bacterium]